MKRKERRGFWGKKFIEVATFVNDKKAAKDKMLELEIQGLETDLKTSYKISDLDTPIYTIFARHKIFGVF